MSDQILLASPQTFPRFVAMMRFQLTITAFFRFCVSSLTLRIFLNRKADDQSDALPQVPGLGGGTGERAVVGEVRAGMSVCE